MPAAHELSLARRQFLQGAAGGAVAAAGVATWADFAHAAADELKREGMSCILLWMSGGPSQFETFSPKPGHANSGDTKAIATSVAGIEVADTLPEVAQCMDDLCIIRSMTSREGSHPRATFLLQTSYLPSAGIKYPAIGANLTAELRDESCELPGFVRVGRNNSAGGGFLGVTYDPFVVPTAGRVPENATVTSTRSRFERRLSLLDRVDAGYERAGGDALVEDHRQQYRQAAQMVLSPRMQAFDLSRESSQVRSDYGSGPFASGCLLARRLVEQGVSFVEVVSGGWDTHQENRTRHERLCGQIDRPFAALLRDLKQRGMLERTLVMWMGEFGRTPRINANGGRDHYPRAFNVALAGAGIRGGQVIGRTDRGGSEITDRPVSVQDLLRTVCAAVKVDGEKERLSSVGRPVKIVDGGQVVKEALV